MLHLMDSFRMLNGRVAEMTDVKEEEEEEQAGKRPDHAPRHVMPAPRGRAEKGKPGHPGGPARPAPAKAVAPARGGITVAQEDGNGHGTRKDAFEEF
jgi:hypothetical protein